MPVEPGASLLLHFHDRLLPMYKQVWRRIPLAVSRYPCLSRALPAAGVPGPMRHLATTSGPSPNDPFASGTNTYYVDEMYRLWKQDQTVVHPSWHVYFSGMDKGLSSPQAFQPPPTHLPHPADGAPALHPVGGAELDLHLKVQLLVRAYQVRGHHVADLDPLGILDADLADVHPAELELSRYGFTERDLDRDITLGPGILPHFATEDHKTMKLREIITLLKRLYCKHSLPSPA